MLNVIAHVRSEEEEKKEKGCCTTLPLGGVTCPDVSGRCGSALLGRQAEIVHSGLALRAVC